MSSNSASDGLFIYCSHSINMQYKNIRAIKLYICKETKYERIAKVN